MLSFPGQDPIGYTYRAENYPASQIIEVLEQSNSGLHFPAVSYDSYTPEGMLQRLAFLNEIEYDDPRSYDSDDFPKPIFEDQLSCSDKEWTELAPDHVFEFIQRDDGMRHCRTCLVAEPSSYWTVTAAAVLVDQRIQPGRLIIWWTELDGREGYWEDDAYDVVYFDHIIDAEGELRKYEFVAKPHTERGVNYIISTAEERGLA